MACGLIKVVVVPGSHPGCFSVWSIAQKTLLIKRLITSNAQRFAQSLRQYLQS
jgi:hypothetical protein